MKKFFMLFSVITITAASVKAQNATFGIKAGMAASNIKATNDELGLSASLKTKIGAYAGFISEFNISEEFALQPELYFSQMGTKAKGNNSGEIDMDYISLPVLAKYMSDGFSAFVGPQIGYLVSAKVKTGGQSENIKDEMKSLDFSGVVGVGYTLPMGLGIDARYQAGIANIDKDSGGGKTRNNAFMVGIHYFFNRQAAY